MLQKDILNWYEASLPVQERKMRGHFSTPPQLVERILDACGYTPDNDLACIRVLDPACGSGNFLAGVARRLLASGRNANLSLKEQIASVQRNIWGFDPDPIACFLAEMQLRAILTEENSENYPSPCEHHRYTRAVPLHIHQADGLAFPWEQQENVDLFLANPPYLAAKNNDLSGYQVARQRGQADSYLLFLSLALQVVRPGGWIGLVIPDPVLARANAMLERQRLLAETTVHHLWHLSGVFSAYVGAVVIIAQKCPPRPVHSIAWQRKVWSRLNGDAAKPDLHVPHIQEVNSAIPSMVSGISQPLLRNQPGAELRYLLSGAQNSLVGRLHAYRSQTHDSQERLFVPLGELVDIRRGEELGKDSKLLFKTRLDDGREWYPVLRGGSDIRPYATPVGDCRIVRDKIVKPMERYCVPKLLVVKSTGRLQAALDLRAHVVLQTLYLLYLRNSAVNHITDSYQNDELYFLLALLNSRLLQEYVYVLYTAYKWVQPQIEQHVLAHLPVPTVEAVEKEQISQCARALMHVCSERMPVVELSEQYKQMYEELERAICALFEKVLNSR